MYRISKRCAFESGRSRLDASGSRGRVRVAMTTRLRVLTWNVLAPEYSAPGIGEHDFYEWVRPWVPWPVRAPRIVERIQQMAPDIACLQEVSPEPWEELGAALGPTLAGERLGKRLPRQRDGVATLVRSEHVEVLHSHALSFHDGTGFVCLVQHLRVGDREVVVANGHLKWSKDTTTQPAQLREVFDALDAMPPAPRIICGDLNFDPREHEIWTELAERGFACAYPERSPTWSANNTALRLDEILYGPEFAVESIEPLRVIDASVPLPDAVEPSDHLPMFATLRFL